MTLPTSSLRVSTSRALWLALAAVVALALGACHDSDARATKQAGDAAPVTVASVTQQDVAVEVRAFGLVEAIHTVNVVAQVTGLITEVHFKEGDAVKKGALLFTVDTRPYRASLALAQAELARTEVMAGQAQVEAQRYRRLHEQGLASEQELKKAEADAASAAAAVAMGRAQAQSANLNVNYTRITAPMDGRTGTVLVHAGNFVQASDARSLVVIRSVQPAQVRFAVPQEHLTRIREKLASTPLPVRATPRGSDVPPALGALTFLESSVDTATGTLSLKATFPNADEALWPGAAVDVVLELDVDRSAIVAPEAAIQVGQDGSYAYVVQDGKALRRSVKVARSTSRISVITEGLKPGEQVVTDGQVRLRDGTRVSIKPMAPDGERAPGPPAGATSG